MKSILYKIYYTLLLIMAAAITAFAQTAQQSASLSGSLQDEQGKPMMYATASL
ncbi:MAG: hypothetical protein JWR54_3893, partial [Mucilaginibacter sp.]|nr:hypothetical protein [Mucilaginibacter sp.]